MRDLFQSIADLRPTGAEGHRYAIVLAGGDGRRLAPVAQRLYGYPRPKQFCRFGSDRTLLQETLLRAARFAGAANRIVVATSTRHRAEANESLAGWRGVVRVEQSRNLDTTPGLLLPLLHVLARDPWATVAVLPSDHHVSDDEAFVDALTAPLVALDAAPDTVLLAGARLRAPEPDLGWIVPGPSAPAWRSVKAFVEKPPPAEAAALHASGAFANTFAFVGRGAAIARLARAHVPEWWRAITGAFFDPVALEGVYRALPPSSFSRDVLERGAGSLGVVPLEGVQWSDVGTPERLLAARGPSAAALVACA